MIFAGQLTETLKFYQVVETQSASGFKHTEEQLICTTKAYRMKNKENYLVDGNELFHTSELTFRLRIRSGITETCIVVYNGERYRITSLDIYKPDNQLTIMISKIND